MFTVTQSTPRPDQVPKAGLLLPVIPEEVYRQWQEIVNLIARLAKVPACLLMRVDHDDIEVFVSSQAAENPYTCGEKEHLFGSGLYCERVINSNEQLQVANALASSEWCDNPDLAHGMICYLGFPIRLSSGTIFGTLCILDRQERHFEQETIELLEKMRCLVEANLQLHISERRHLLLAENALDNIWSMGADRTFTYISPSIEVLTGYTPHEYLQLTLEQILCPASFSVADEYLHELIKSLHAGEPLRPFRGELELCQKDGSSIWTEVHVNPLVDSEGTFVELVGITRDITERKRYEYEIIRARVAAESSSKVASEMMGAIAHQWRQPLSTVDMVVQSIRKAFEVNRLDHDFITRAVIDARRQITFMSDTINTFRSFFHATAEKTFFDTGVIIRDVITLLEQPLGSNKITLATSLQRCSPVLGNPHEFQQVLMNILINAQEAIVAGRSASHHEPGSIVISQQQQGNQLKIMIQDNGGGIDPAVEPRIFEPYFTTKKESGGSGIGLYLSKMIIEKSMQGSLTVTNQDGGAIFTICLQGAAHV
ncbi:MAG: PAS domain S-box protein [Geobacter sp.]|nr:PAS domain S-box protein [Geobacter sp.]